MVVKSNFYICAPKGIEMTMSITMTVGEWMELKEKIAKSAEYWSTSSAFVRSIDSLVSMASKEFTAYESDAKKGEGE